MNLPKILTLGLLFIGITVVAQKQRMEIPETKDEIFSCGSASYEEMLRTKYPQMGSRASFENVLKNVIKARAAQRTHTHTIDTIPVIVHVVHDGDAVGTAENISSAQVMSQFTVLNNDYASMNLVFVPAQISPDGNPMPEPGIRRLQYSNFSSWSMDSIESKLKPETQWNPNAYLNIWVVTFGGSNTGLLGYAQFPERATTNLEGLDLTEVAKTDGVVISCRAFGTTGNISSRYNQGRTTTHEIGHFLGLIHTWGDQTDCSGTDYCDDTNPCSDAFYSTKTNCPAPTQCSGKPRMIENFMDYSDDFCMNSFTANQITRMQAVLASSPRRKLLLTSAARRPSNRPIAYFNNQRKLIQQGDSIPLTSSATQNPTSYVFGVYPTGNAYPLATYAGANVKIKIAQPGVFDVNHTAGNGSGFSNLLAKEMVGSLSTKQLWLPYNENFENGGFLDQWMAFNLDSTTNLKISTPRLSFDGSNRAVIGKNNVATATLFANNYEDDYSNTFDGFFSPKINLAGLSNPVLQFDVAYSTIVVNFIRYTDSLLVLATTNTGASYSTLWKQGGTQLQTFSSVNKGFIPTQASHWKTIAIPLTNWVNQGDFNLVFYNKSGFGNNLYIDNISLTASPTQAPVTNFYTDSKTVCLGNSVQFRDSTQFFPGLWTWTFTGASPATSSLQNPTVAYNSIGKYTVSLSTSNAIGAGNTETKQDYITVIAPPTFNQQDSLLTTTLTSGIQWMYNGLAIPGATTTSFIATANGNYSVANTNAGLGCVSLSKRVITALPENTSLPLDANPIIAIYPNPVDNELNVVMQTATNAVSLDIYNLLGEKVELPLSATEQGFSIPTTSLAPGIYVLSIQYAGNRTIQRFVKL